MKLLLVLQKPQSKTSKTKDAKTETSYFLKQEIARNLNKYVDNLKELPIEAIDLGHNNPKNVYYKRKVLFEEMHVYELELRVFLFRVKLGKYKDGTFNLYCITEP